MQEAIGSTMAPNTAREPEHSIILSLVCELDINGVHGNLSNPFFLNKVCGQKRPREVNKRRNSI